MAVYYLSVRLLALTFGLDLAGRGRVVLEPLSRLAWLGTEVVPVATKLWAVVLPETAAWAVLALLLALAAVRAQRASPEPVSTLACRGLLIAGACILTMFPHLTVYERVVRLRAVLPLSAALALLAFAALSVSRWPRGLLPLVVVALTAWRALELARYGVAPERALVAAAAAQLRETRPSRVFVLRPGDDDRVCVARLSNDEFTAPSSQRDFAIPGLLRLASDVARVAMPTDITQGESLTAAPASYAVIDLKRIDPAFCPHSWL